MDTKGGAAADGEPYAEAAARAQAIVEGAEFTEAEVDTINLVPDEYRGLDRFEARKLIVAAITEEGLAVTVPSIDRNGANPSCLTSRRSRSCSPSATARRL